MDLSHFKNIVWKEDEHYVAQSLNVDVSSFGVSKGEALSNLREALELYFEDIDVNTVPNIADVEFATV
jgi:predicted RNase H-like HicB family nuclease